MKTSSFIPKAVHGIFGSHVLHADHGNTGQAQSSTWPDFLDSETGRPVRVIMIDDDPHIRCVVVGELVSDMRIDLLAQADSLKEGRRLISKFEFDVMIVDLNLGDGSGFELIEFAKQLRPQAEVVVISVLDDEQRAMRAFELGATGYLVKNNWFGSFSQAVLQVFNGGASITPSLARRLLGKLEHPMHLHVDSRDGQARQALSAREREVLRLVAQGYTSSEAAHKLALSVQTVNTHIRNIYRKLQVKSRAQAVNLAAHEHLI
jgi:DNA-binding NarL/FixJ family response regulator